MDSTLDVTYVLTSSLFLSPSNPRFNDEAVPHVAASLRRFGFRQPIVAKKSGEVIAGNTRLKAALSLGIQNVPVTYFEGTDLEATAYAIADNRTHEFSRWDEPALGKLLRELQAEDIRGEAPIHGARSRSARHAPRRRLRRPTPRLEQGLGPHAYHRHR